MSKYSDPTEPIRAALPVVSPLSETAHPTTDPTRGGTVYHDMTWQARTLVACSYILWALGGIIAAGASLLALWPPDYLYIALWMLALAKPMEGVIRAIADGLDNGTFDGSYKH